MTLNMVESSEKTFQKVCSHTHFSMQRIQSRCNLESLLVVVVARRSVVEVVVEDKSTRDASVQDLTDLMTTRILPKFASRTMVSLQEVDAHMSTITSESVTMNTTVAAAIVRLARRRATSPVTVMSRKLRSPAASSLL